MSSRSRIFTESWLRSRSSIRKTLIADFSDPAVSIPVYINEFWTSKQRAAHSLHEISYRACFKPQLPGFFIRRLTRKRDIVYDPFMGRGTTPIEADLLGRIPAGCDINPLSRLLVEPRFTPPSLTAITDRLRSLDLASPTEVWEDLLIFYHPLTLTKITNLRNYMLARESEGSADPIDAWIRMVARGCPKNLNFEK